jgi:folate-dependent tRNA-U54 methylase TrmFO/GidA
MSSQILPRSSPFAMARRVKSMTCCEVKQSQIPAGSALIVDGNSPSQARTRNSSSPSILCVMISGSAVTICFSGSSE